MESLKVFASETVFVTDGGRPQEVGDILSPIQFVPFCCDQQELLWAPTMARAPSFSHYPIVSAACA